MSDTADNDLDFERDALHERNSEWQDIPPPPPSDVEYHCRRHGSTYHDEHKRSHSVSMDFIESKNSDKEEKESIRPSDCIRNSDFVRDSSSCSSRASSKSSKNKAKGPRESERHLGKTKEKLTNLERLSKNMERASENLMRASEKLEQMQQRATDHDMTADAKHALDRSVSFEHDCGSNDDGAKDGAQMLKSDSSRMRALSQGLQPGTTVVVKERNEIGVIVAKSAFNGVLKYEIKLRSDPENSSWYKSHECEISEPPYGWVVEWQDEYFNGTTKSGFVIGASWFRKEKKVEVELEKNVTVWKLFEDVRFVSPMTGTRVAVTVDEGDDEEGDEKRIKSGVVEGKKEFRGKVEFQVKFDGNGGDGWFKLSSFINPNDFMVPPD